MNLSGHFSNENKQMTDEHIKKMLNIIIYQENANEYHNKILAHIH